MSFQGKKTNRTSFIKYIIKKPNKAGGRKWDLVKCYKELEKEDTIWIEGRIEAKQIVIKEFKAKHD